VRRPMRRSVAAPAAGLDVLNGGAPPLDGADPDAEARARDRAAAERDAAAARREGIVLAALGQHGHRVPKQFVRGQALTSVTSPQAFDVARLAATADWPGVVRTLLEAAAVDRALAARDRERAAKDREAAAAFRARAGFDDLTGAWRRTTGVELLGTELNRASRAGSSLVVAYLDVAGLRAVNDAFGHAAGDSILVALVNILRGRLRSYDAIVRMGGDDFVCVLPNVGMRSVERRVRLIRLELRGLVPPITMRVGLASRKPGDTTTSLLARANGALLAARGRPAYVPVSR
jgi:diguanylate cyclase (GGDEF)-like protein